MADGRSVCCYNSASVVYVSVCRYGEKAARWQCVDEGLSLGQLLAQEDYVVPGVPLLFAVAKGTEYRTRFLAQAGK